jgi:glutathione reductase (NADPH)
MAEGDTHFDYLVIGAGSGGMASARRAAGHGAKVALLEGARLGGTCVNVGCVPKKVMFNAASVAETMHTAHQFGFKVDGYSLDWNKLKTTRDNYVLRLNGIYGRNVANSNIDLFSGFGKFVDDKSVEVDGKVLTADNILIAVGGKPFVPDIPGKEHGITSDGFFELESQPKSVAVIGGGYIGVELGGVFHGLGTHVELFTRSEKPLPGFDSLIVDTLMSEMKKSGLVLHGNSDATAIEKGDDGMLTLVTKDGEKHGPFEQVLFAAGRVPLIENLGLDKTNVKTNGRGFIEADDFQETGVKGLYALGDVCGKVQLTPTAIAAGRRLADRLFNKAVDSKADYDDVPTVVFSHPTIGTIGLTEDQAIEKFGKDNLKVYTSTFTNLFYGTWDMEPAEKPKTSMKLVTTLPDEKIVGLHVIGMGADEMLQGFGVAVKMGATKADLDSCIAIHPTAAEELVTLAPWGTAPARKH